MTDVNNASFSNHTPPASARSTPDDDSGPLGAWNLSRLTLLLANHGAFGVLDEVDRYRALRTCLAGAEHRSWHEGQVLFAQGEPAGHFAILTSGRVDVLRHGADGSERVFGRFGLGDTIAEASMFMRTGRYPASARALADSTGWWCPRESLRNAALMYPEFSMALLENISMRMQQRVNELDRLLSVNAPQRLAGWFLEQFGLQGPRIRRNIKQSQLATELAMRPETLSRLLSQWRSCGWLQHERDHWVLCAPDALHDLARAG